MGSTSCSGRPAARRAHRSACLDAAACMHLYYLACWASVHFLTCVFGDARQLPLRTVLGLPERRSKLP